MTRQLVFDIFYEYPACGAQKTPAEAKAKPRSIDLFCEW
jgi:hypothetical protein